MGAVGVGLSGRAILFGGDFNLSGEDAHDASLVARYLDEGGLSEGCDAIDCAEPGRIDRFFFRSSDSLRLTPLHWEVQEGFIDDSGTPLSDHDPIAMTFRWEVLATNPGP